MEPLDLSKKPPRSPREKLDGVVLMPRTIDKLRSQLPGGNPGSYRIPGFSARALEIIGVSEADLLAVVRSATSDADVAVWLREHADTSAYPRVNAHFESLDYAGVKDPEGFDQRYPIRKKLGLTNLFDVLEADDREMFG